MLGDASAKLPPGVAAIPRIRSPEYTLAGPDFTGATTPPAALASSPNIRFVLAEVARRNAQAAAGGRGAGGSANMLMQASRRVGNGVECVVWCESLLTTPQVPLSYSRHTSDVLTMSARRCRSSSSTMHERIPIPAVAFIGWASSASRRSATSSSSPSATSRSSARRRRSSRRAASSRRRRPVRRLGRLASEQVHAIAATAPPAPQKRRPWWRLSHVKSQAHAPSTYDRTHKYRSAQPADASRIRG